MITLYWAPRSRAGRMLQALEEVGVDYRLELVDLRADPPRWPDGFAEASPMRKVPALRDGNVAMADSAAIALYLADRYSPGDLAPLPDDPLRGQFLFWMFFTPSTIEPAMVDHIAHLPPNPIGYAWGSFERTMGAVEERLTGRDWLVGDRYTMADTMVGTSLATIRAFHLADLTPLQEAYADRVMARPAAQRAREREAVEMGEAELR